MATSRLNAKVERIFDVINGETRGMDPNERTMVLLLVAEFLKCAAQLDVLDTLMPKKESVSDD